MGFSVPLFVPGHRPERFEKAAFSEADAVILDLEDAVPVLEKDKARASLRVGFSDKPVLVRINGLGTPWHEADLKAIVEGGLDGVVVPKAEGSQAFEDLCTQISLPVIPLIESARGIADARRIAAMPNVLRLAFGSIDFCADLGCAHTNEALLAARSDLVLSSRLASLVAPIDGVTTSIDDEAAIFADARYARDLGFAGKLSIHPRQVSAIKSGLSPDENEILWACKVLTTEDGAASVDGSMVDEPVRIRARDILKRAKTEIPLIVLPISK
ncbi:CoA ester lyase [Bosea vestrisii]|uniref:HpcH/HpaI aldolase/citrate lyase family protein n=1 Tax=Bosea vestrisii TaxID=151416 RepID=UPI0024DF9041|nr:CoA ester lyase [Bosea vestrisii]WID95192.1 CoA ester lyase [Bosea vestrisii]